MECPECHNIFNPIVVKATRKFCSFSCKRKASKKRWLAKNRLKKVKVLFCLNCGKPIESPKIRYCSDKCADMYYRDNLRDKEKQKQYAKNNRKKRRKLLTVKLRKRISARIKGLLKGERHTVNYRNGVITYSEVKLKSHLSKQFKDGMSWDNYGTVWHIDHKIPVSAFNLRCEEDIKRCWALKNLQPMFADENVMKSDKLDKPFQPMLI
jgi:predicted nucleic acid-binding Zn ribbon protein